MLWKNTWTGLLEVLAAEDRMQRGGSKEKEGERNGGYKGETERKRKQIRDGGDGQENRGHVLEDSI